MSTSGNTQYVLTTSMIITKAFEILEVIRPGDSVPGEDYSSALVSLNLMVKSWQAKGIYMHATDEATLFLNVGQRKYQMGNNSPDHVASNSTLIETTVTQDHVTTNTLLTITSTAGMAATDIVGLVLNNSTIQWTTVSAVNSATTFTITNALTSNMNNGNYVFSYSETAGRPLEILSSMLRQAGGTDNILNQYISEVPMVSVGQEEYFRYPSKGTQGTPLQYFFEKKNNYVNILLFPAPSTVNYRVKLLYKRVFENFDSSSDNPDLPQEFGEALVYGLAARLAPQVRRLDLLEPMAQMAQVFLDDAISTTQENNTSLIIRPKF